MSHFTEYLCEFAGTAFMMAFGVGAIVLFWAPGSPLPPIPVERLRLLVTGICFAGGATLVVYSPVGQRSGGHLNPAVTLGFWRLRKISTSDACAYVLAQTLGAVAGVAVVLAVAGPLARAVKLGLTTPGPGVSGAWGIAYELAITFALMFTILTCLNKPKVAPYTGLLAGSLVAILVGVEAPLTGTSLNPARSLAPALLMRDLSGVWIYLVGPPIGALLAVAAWKGRWGARQSMICAKLYHGRHPETIFHDCPYLAVSAGAPVIREGEPGDAAFVIESGRLEVQKRGADGRNVTLATLRPGDWFGEMSVLLDDPRSATVVAVTDARLRRVTRDLFESALMDDPRHAILLLRQVASRMREADRKLAAG